MMGDSIMMSDNIIVEGIYSHLPNSDSKNEVYNKTQIKLFNEILDTLDLKKYNLKIHLLSSGGLFNFKDL